jgi:hypothetical protein
LSARVDLRRTICRADCIAISRARVMFNLDSRDQNTHRSPPDQFLTHLVTAADFFHAFKLPGFTFSIILGSLCLQGISNQNTMKHLSV